MKEGLKLVFSPQGTYAQELLVTELVGAVDVLSREALGEAARLALTSTAAVGALAASPGLMPLQALFFPPGMQLASLVPSLNNVAGPQLSSADKQALNTIQGILELITPDQAAKHHRSNPTGAPFPLDFMTNFAPVAVSHYAELGALFMDLAPGLRVTAELFIRRLARRIALRLAHDLTGRLGDEWAQEEWAREITRV